MKRGDPYLKRFEISSHDSARLIQQQVNGLVKNCFSDPDWLSVFEAYSGLTITPCHQIATSNGTPIAFLPAYVKSESLCGTLRDRLLGRYSSVPVFKRWGRQNALVCSSPWGFYSGIECGAEDRIEVFNTLLSHIDQVARSKGLGLTGFTFVPESSHELRTQLRANGYKGLPAGPTTILELKWKSFDDYVAGFPSSRFRRCIRRERKEAKRLSFEWVEGDSLEKQYFGRPLHCVLMELYNNTHYKHYGRKSILNDSFLSELWRVDNPNLRLCIAILGRRIVSFVLMRVFGATSHAFMLGRDYSIADDFYAYFNVAYYEPIIRGIDEGWHAIDYQPGALQAKLKRGWRLENLYLYVKAHNLFSRAFLQLYFPVAEKYFRDKYSGFTAPSLTAPCKTPGP